MSHFITRNHIQGDVFIFRVMCFEFKHMISNLKARILTQYLCLDIAKCIKLISLKAGKMHHRYQLTHSVQTSKAYFAQPEVRSPRESTTVCKTRNPVWLRRSQPARQPLPLSHVRAARWTVSTAMRQLRGRTMPRLNWKISLIRWEFRFQFDLLCLPFGVSLFSILFL